MRATLNYTLRHIQPHDWTSTLTIWWSVSCISANYNYSWKFETLAEPTSTYILISKWVGEPDYLWLSVWQALFCRHVITHHCIFDLCTEINPACLLSIVWWFFAITLNFRSYLQQTMCMSWIYCPAVHQYVQYIERGVYFCLPVLKVFNIRILSW